MVTTIHTFIVTMCHLNSKILNIYLIVHLIVQMQSSFNIFEINHNKIIFKTKLNTRAPSQSFCQKNNVERLVKKKKRIPTHATVDYYSGCLSHKNLVSIFREITHMPNIDVHFQQPSITARLL